MGTRLPRNWKLHDFGKVEPLEFLRGIDFFVYYHHPDWVEGFGRAIAEAAASGAVVIVPEYCASLSATPRSTARPQRSSQRSVHFSPTGRHTTLSRGSDESVDESYGPRRFLQRIRSLIGDPVRPTERKAGFRGGHAATRSRKTTGGAKDFGIIHLGDLRTRGAAAWRIANQVQLEADNGYRVGLVHAPTRGTPYLTIHPLIDDLARSRLALPIHPESVVTARLLLIHDPTAVCETIREGTAIPEIAAEEIIALCDTRSTPGQRTRKDRLLKSAFGPHVGWSATHASLVDVLNQGQDLHVRAGPWSPAVQPATSVAAGRQHRRPFPVLGTIWTGAPDIDGLQAYRMIGASAVCQGEAIVRLMDAPSVNGSGDYPWPDNFELCTSDVFSPWKFLETSTSSSPSPPLLATVCRRSFSPQP